MRLRRDDQARAATVADSVAALEHLGADPSDSLIGAAAPRRRSDNRARGAVWESAGIVGLLGTLAVLHRLGWAGREPFWLLLTWVALFAIARVPRVSKLLWRSGSQRQLWLRMGIDYLILLTPALYLTGWGPVAAGAYVTLSSRYIDWCGSRAWRPALVFTAAGTSIGQLAITVGITANYVGLRVATVIWALGLVGVSRAIHQSGLASERAEHDARQLRESRRSAMRSERWFRALVQNTSDVISVTDAHGVVQYMSPSVLRHLGYFPEDMVGRQYSCITDRRDFPAAEALWTKLKAEPQIDHHCELRFLHHDGSSAWHEVIAHNMLSDPDIAGIVVNHRDIHDRRTYQDEVAYQASHDSLTGLANRAEMLRVLTDELVVDAARLAAGTTSSGAALLFIDLDGFKPINDRFGHETGDMVLVAVAELLERCVLGGDTVARIGGDEFAILATGIARPADACAVAQRIIDALRSPLSVPGIAEVAVGASIGIALAGPASDAAELLRRADHAMYEAKRLGNNQYRTAPMA